MLKTPSSTVATRTTVPNPSTVATIAGILSKQHQHSPSSSSTPIVPPAPSSNKTMVVGTKSSPRSEFLPLNKQQHDTNKSHSFRMDLLNGGSFGSIKVTNQNNIITTQNNNRESTGRSLKFSPGRIPSALAPFTDSSTRIQIQQYLHTVSGQLRKQSILEIEHNYCKPFHVHPDPLIKLQPAKFLFMKNFPQHMTRAAYQQSNDDEELDVVNFEETKKIPFLTPKPPSQPVVVDGEWPEIDQSILDGWNCEKTKLWTRATKIMYADRMARLSFEGNANEVLLKRNLQENTANRFRELFASTLWDFKLVTWLHETLMRHLEPCYQSVYVESLCILKQKIPSLIDQFYHPDKKQQQQTGQYQNQDIQQQKGANNKAPVWSDPLFNTLSHYKPKKLPRKPTFILVPSGPQQSNNHLSSSTSSPRWKYWISLLSSMGKLVQIQCQAKPTDFIADILNDIRCLVNDKIKYCKNSGTTSPVVLVGFNTGAVIAAHCALQNERSVAAVICLGFPLKTINGCRGELGDTLLELSCPIQFVIGENSVMTSLDDIEDFRERMTKSETSLIMVGGADDKLVVSNMKKRLECLTQSMVDRCIADEIASFLQPILLNYSEQLDHPPSFGLGDSSRIFKFCGQHGLTDANDSTLASSHIGLAFSGSTSLSKKSKNRKRLKNSLDGLYTPAGGYTKLGRPPRDSKRPRINKPRPPRNKNKSRTDLNLSNHLISTPQSTTTSPGSLTPGPSSFAQWVPLTGNASQPATPHTAPAILDPNQFMSAEKQELYTKIKIEKSKIISISDASQPIIQPVTQITKRIVKTKPSTGSNSTPNSSPLTTTITIASQVSTPVTTPPATPQPTTPQTTPIPVGGAASEDPNQTQTNLDSKLDAELSSTPASAAGGQQSTSRTGRQIKPPKALVDF